MQGVNRIMLAIDGKTNIFYRAVLKENTTAELKLSLNTLKSEKTSPAKIKMSQVAPSILGLDFLKSKKLSLHVFMSEDLAYLEFEE